MTNHNAGSATGIDLSAPTTLWRVIFPDGVAVLMDTEPADIFKPHATAYHATPQHSVTEQDERGWPAGYAAWLRATGAYPFDNDKRNQVDAFKAGAEWARAQPLASTAAQPEQAALLKARDAINGLLWQFTSTPSTYRDSNARAQGHEAVKAIDAALAIPASTAANEQQASVSRADLESITRYGYLPGGDEPSGYILRDELDAVLTHRATTAADQQGDTASASIGSDSNFRDLAVAWASKKYAVITSGHEAAWSDLVAHVDGRAQQGAAQAQAGGLKSCECSPAQRRKCDVCAGYGSAAMAAPTTTGGSNV